MRTAILTDLHANREAVGAVLEHAAGQRVQRHALLGDFVGYGADPAWVVDVVHDLVRGGAIAVMGNHDQAVVDGATDGMRSDPRRVVEWTRARLSPAQIRFLAQLPMTAERGDVLFVHANAWAPAGWAYITDRNEATRSLAATDRHLTCCGHVHEPHLYHLAPGGRTGEFVPVPGTPIPLTAGRRWLAIPGSAGQPRDGNPAACYAVLDEAALTLTYWRVPYDVEAAQEKMRAALLPQRLAARLADGQ
ncbi:MAG: metallophosphatase family protein [Rubrivivax sp.]|nr:metallophosphatase family protein [Rubrivivax sp.]